MTPINRSDLFVVGVKQGGSFKYPVIGWEGLNPLVIADGRVASINILDLGRIEKTDSSSSVYWLTDAEHASSEIIACWRMIREGAKDGRNA